MGYPRGTARTRAEGGEKFDIRQHLVEGFVRKLTEGVAPWKQGWVNTGQSSAVSAVGNRRYRGVNVILLMVAMLTHGYARSRWITFKQAVDQGGTLKPDAKQDFVPVAFWKRFDKVNRETGRVELDANGRPRQTMMLRYYRVFNVDCFEGLPDKIAIGPSVPADADVTQMGNDAADSVMKAYLDTAGLKYVEGGDVACYNPSMDVIRMPPRVQFAAKHKAREKDLKLGGMGEDEAAKQAWIDVASQFYGVQFHEAIHSTGHKSRLARNLQNRFGSADYAFEELIAELGAAFILAELGLPGYCMHAEYLADWARRVSSDPNVLFKAATDASRAADFVFGRTQETAEDEQESASEEDSVGLPKAA